MRTIELGTTGVQVSAISLGCMPMGTIADEETSVALLDRYVADGGSFLDTADCYAWWWAKGTDGGQSEELLGRWMAARRNRDDLVLATKGTARVVDLAGVWPEGADEPDWGLARSRFVGASARVLRESLEGSLRRLGTDHVDLYYVHVDDRRTPLEETLETLAAFVAEGKIRFYGWSNVRAWRLEAVLRLCEANGWPKPVAVQQQHTYLQPRGGTDNASVVTPEALDHLRSRPEVTLVAYSPLLKGVYDLPQAERERHWLYADYAGEHTRRRLEALDKVAADLGVPAGRVVVAWLLAQRDPRVVPLVGTSRVDRWADVAAALDLELSSEHLAVLDA